MTPPTNGITADVIRDVMPPYELSADLLAAALASIPRPPPGATQAWRQVRTLRFVREIAGLMPADAPQARIAEQILYCAAGDGRCLRPGEHAGADGGADLPAAADRGRSDELGGGAGAPAGAAPAEAGAVLRRRAAGCDRCAGARAMDRRWRCT